MWGAPVWATAPATSPSISSSSSALPASSSGAAVRNPLAVGTTVPLDAYLQQSPHHFEQLFSMLDLQLDAGTTALDVSAAVWRILQALPTHVGLLADLRSLKAAEGGSWISLLDPTSLYKFLYTLHIIDAFLTRAAVASRQVGAVEARPAKAVGGGMLAWSLKFIHLEASSILWVLRSASARNFSATRNP